MLPFALAALLFPTSAAPQDAYPVWSPDARYIAFQREEPPGFGSHEDVFVDRSRNRSRRYCCDLCADRATQAAARRRRRAKDPRVR